MSCCHYEPTHMSNTALTATQSLSGSDHEGPLQVKAASPDEHSWRTANGEIIDGPDGHCWRFSGNGA
jgi:hypothetical protein